MRDVIFVGGWFVLLILTLVGCEKQGVDGGPASYNWHEIQLPPACRPKSIAGAAGGMAVLCEDGRVFH